MSKTYFTTDHEWVAVEGDIGTVGITNYAQHALGDIVFVELPDLGKSVAKGKEIAVVESVKAASDVYSPVTGEVVAINEAVVEQPGMVNEAPEDNAWFVKIRLSNASELDGLMDHEAYSAFVNGLE
jgi:glycine cleavage system H protein